MLLVCDRARQWPPGKGRLSQRAEGCKNQEDHSHVLRANFACTHWQSHLHSHLVASHRGGVLRPLPGGSNGLSRLQPSKVHLTQLYRVRPARRIAFIGLQLFYLLHFISHCPCLSYIFSPVADAPLYSDSMLKLKSTMHGSRGYRAAAYLAAKIYIRFDDEPYLSADEREKVRIIHEGGGEGKAS